ncbi:Methyl-accepting chemotaxis protein [Limimonas halophila]|uniref:Methyl-accepting chemotaxis protein n=1 Tax=Limimonas halophila TaxID=1082479 RepID=A0A1G7QNF5_9PROT|nr:methyl-accepting chemotaxis protein [Limimonas halophila]SDG00013.1 Methyl-accepting chemotaxis protein [Limimonas halophila]
MHTVRLATKLPVVVTVSALMVAAVTGGVSFLVAKDSLYQASRERLAALLETRGAAIEAYAGSVRRDLELLATSEQVRAAADAFRIAHTGLGFDENAMLRKVFVEQNPKKPENRSELIEAEGRTASSYNRPHANHHPFFRSFARVRGYADIYLVSAKGDVIYSVNKRADFARNLNDGKWAKTGLGRVYAAARKAEGEPKLHFTGFRAYAPLNGAPSGFVARRVLSADGKLLGVIAARLPAARVSQLTAKAPGLGRTGEIVAVGGDGRLRTDVRGLDGSQILDRSVDNAAVRAAQQGRTGAAEVTGLRGNSALTVYEPVTVLGERWALLAQQDLSEINAPANALVWRVLAVIALAGGLVAAAGWLFARTTARPIAAMTDAMKTIAQGTTDIEVPGRTRRDEIGDMADACAVFRDAIRDSQKLAEEEQAKQERQAARARKLAELTDAFDRTATQVLESVGQQTSALSNTADRVHTIAETANGKARQAATGAQEANANVQTVATAAERLDASIQAIAGQVSDATQVANDAVAEADRAGEQVRSLSEAADKIGEVVTMIQDIAEKTNLLALNATIEAARAGEAGKGFAVVADEVKTLANQTSKATQDIGEHVQRVQAETGDAVTAIERIGESIRRIDTQAGEIAGAIEQQREAASEITGNAQHAAKGTQDASQYIEEVSSAADETDQAAGDVVASVRALTEQADHLRGEVDRFLQDVRGI